MTENPVPDPNLILQKIFGLEKNAKVDSYIAEDNYTLNLLQPLINGYPYLPFTGSSLRPFCLAHMINDIVINSRKNIIEFGSGISTVMIGRLIKRNNLNATLLSIEHDEGWVNVLNLILRNEQLDDVIQVKHSPLNTCELALDNNEWYDVQTLKDHTKRKKFDMVIIDGPPAWEASKGTARYPAVDFISNKLSKNFSIYLDDAIRRGEQEIIKKWETDYGIQFTISGKTLAYYYGGVSYNTEPFIYY